MHVHMAGGIIFQCSDRIRSEFLLLMSQLLACCHKTQSPKLIGHSERLRREQNIILWGKRWEGNDLTIPP